ncbi:hypothetical protein PAXRUDRAFT_822632 [Paxillus rubicundulus Ve08.2h10]|uniref:Uncharacterized protein n=1 Tax=Paxillus rubicundulus Ve08.2h10 TaxID=930991 RepID=A0A0D0ECL0_9AGAM|nr:hypothetical protein PAXRUDRAFT_822632 [Paxillus rubicundulus Ve08.2h10]
MEEASGAEDRRHRAPSRNPSAVPRDRITFTPLTPRVVESKVKATRGLCLRKVLRWCMQVALRLLDLTGKFLAPTD